MKYDIIFILGEIYFDHPLCGAAILKRLLEKNGFSVGVISMPTKEEEIKELGEPNLFFAVSSGSIDSMVRNYTPMKKKRIDDENLDYSETVPDRAVTVFSNWIRKNYKSSKIVLGGIEASLRRFTHYDYWQNRLRKPILFDTRADILIYGAAEKPIVKIAQNLQEKKEIDNIKGTCIISKKAANKITILPSFEEVSNSKEQYCKMQKMFTINKALAQLIDTRYVIQHQAYDYTTEDLDEYYELPFTREVPRELRGFEFSVVTHRGCIGNCNFCSLKLTQGDKIVSRSPKSILKEIEKITSIPTFRGNIDDLTAPSTNMYGLDCKDCNNNCIDCEKVDKSNKKFLELLEKAKKVKGVNNVYIRSGLRYDMLTEDALKKILKFHTFDTLRIAPEHVSPRVLKAMNKDKGNLKTFIDTFKKINTDKELSFYFMVAHPGSRLEDSKKLAKYRKNLKNSDCVQVFTPTPMTDSTCMYYTGIDLKTNKPIHVPYTYNEKKRQKRIVMDTY